jgi:hypothetical protein
MRYATNSGRLVAYEYAISGQSDPRRITNGITSNEWTAFAKDFTEYVWGAGLQNLISLKDESCIAGPEYIALTSELFSECPHLSLPSNQKAVSSRPDGLSMPRVLPHTRRWRMRMSHRSNNDRGDSRSQTLCPEQWRGCIRSQRDFPRIYRSIVDGSRAGSFVDSLSLGGWGVVLLSVVSDSFYSSFINSPTYKEILFPFWRCSSGRIICTCLNTNSVIPIWDDYLVMLFIPTFINHPVQLINSIPPWSRREGSCISEPIISIVLII